MATAFFQGSLNRRRHIQDKAKTIGDLCGIGRAQLSALGVQARSISADHAYCEVLR
jgi:hypothetical protein